jgi:hypothetical protein
MPCLRCLNCGTTFDHEDHHGLQHAVQKHIDIDCRKPIALSSVSRSTPPSIRIR